MTTPSTAFSVRVEEAVRARRSDTIENLGREATLWLAAVPLWTRHVAQAAGFPVESVIEFIRRARDTGWCETRGSLRGEGAPGLRFWMPAEIRRDVLDVLGQGGHRQQLIADARLIAERVDQRVPLFRGETGAGTEVPDALRYWAQLMSHSAPDLTLVDRVAHAVDDQDLFVAQQLAAAGNALAPLLAGTMVLAVDRARRLLSLGARRLQDARALDRYLDRPELSDAVRVLLRPGSRQWALHLRGVGGVGKTMLVRYLASGRYAAERDEPSLTVARVDFDHMNPDYPVRRPVQLLLELADELALHTAAAEQADVALTRFRRMATSVHESLSSVREDHAAPMQNPAVLDTIDTFADTLRLLPRPLLILDTCEELAKADAGDPAAPAVSSTLSIIKRIHDRAPEVRVLLAGRRPLPKRDYLAVEPVRGFTTDEAVRYLSAFAARRLPDDLVRAIIRQSPAVDADPPASGELPVRVSPFDMALYREWADEDPALDVRRVERGSHAYVEGRIIDRLEKNPEVRQALPVLATAGRCRVTTIAAFLGADPAILGPRLAEQEWIESVGAPPTHVMAGTALAQRLRAYFAEPTRSAAFAAETARLAAMLGRQVRDAELDDIDGDELLAALRLSDPADAARLWDGLAGRAAAEGRWTWLFNITRRASGESMEQRWPTLVALRATLLAALISASRRAIPGFNSAAAWAEVRRTADGHPDPEAARYLRIRAVLGSLDHAPDREELWLALEPGFGQYDSAARTAQVAAATADLAHRLLEASHGAAARRLLELVTLEWPEASPLVPGSGDPAEPASVPLPENVAGAWSNYPALRAWLFVAFARVLADGNLPAARTALQTAARLAQEVTAPEAPTPPALSGGPLFWVDLILPDDLVARVLIELGLIDRSDDGARDDTWTTFAERTLRTVGQDMIATIDGERLVSLCLRHLIGYQVIEPSVIRRWEEADEYRPGRVAASSAHDLVPPLFVSVAEAWLAAGDPQRALDHVARHRRQALGTRDDLATVRHADAATVRITRRLRLGDQLALLQLAVKPDPPSPAGLALADDARRALAVLRRESDPYTTADVAGRPAGWHTWWQCQSDPVGPVPDVRWSADDTDTELASDIELDLNEFGRLSRARQQQLLAEPALAAWLARPRQTPRARSAEPYRHLRTELRRSALESAGRLVPPARPELPPGVPPRLVAEMAFEEAELLALRLPDPAVLLFGWAAAAYETARDHTGRLLAELARVTTVLEAQVAGSPPDEAALARFRQAAAQTPSTASIPFLEADGLEDAGPWRYWVRLQLQTTSLGSGPVAADTASRIRYDGPVTGSLAHRQGASRRLLTRRAELITVGRSVLAGVALGLAGSAAVILWALVARLPGFTPLIAAGSAVAVFAVAAAAAGHWRQGALHRLADSVAVGTAFSPSSLEFRALIQPGRQPGSYSAVLWVHLHSPWQLPLRQRSRVFAVVLAVYLASALRPRRGRRDGYRGRMAGASTGENDVEWIGGPPEADSAWWVGPTASGLIISRPADAALPWERIITASLGPDAAGRIEWRRQVFVSADPDSGLATGNLIDVYPYRLHEGVALSLDASPSWTPIYADHYESPASPLGQVQVRHAIGAAITTSAGTRLEVGALTTDATPRMLGTEELRVGDPSLIIVQAEFAAENPSPTPGGDAESSAAAEVAARQSTDELRTQLALAVDLIRSFAAPAVLLLPGLPAAQATLMATAIAGYANDTGRAAQARPPDPAKLQAELRAILRPHVSPTVLDDVVLFINDRG